MPNVNTVGQFKRETVCRILGNEAKYASGKILLCNYDKILTLRHQKLSDQKRYFLLPIETLTRSQSKRH